MATAIQQRDKMALVDFDLPSSQPRFHIVDLASGRSRSLLVAHGRGSDPEHTGFLTRFSNDIGSAASSQGTYLTGDIYVGEHGRSRRLLGLDSTNSNVEPRAVVVHAAWYVGAGHDRAARQARPLGRLFRALRLGSRGHAGQPRPGPDDLRRQGVIGPRR